MGREEDADEMRSLRMDEISELIDGDPFPIATDELLEEYGDVEVEYPNGSDRLETILETSGEEVYESPDDLHHAILNGVERGAVGRPRYSDRGDNPGDADDGYRQQESF